MRINELTPEEQKLFIESIPVEFLRKVFTDCPRFTRELKGFRPQKAPFDKLFNISSNLLIKEKDFKFEQILEDYLKQCLKSIQKHAKQYIEQGYPDAIAFQAALEDKFSEQYWALYLKLFDKEAEDVIEYLQEREVLEKIIDVKIKELNIEERFNQSTRDTEEKIIDVNQKWQAVSNLLEEKDFACNNDLENLKIKIDKASEQMIGIEQKVLQVVDTNVLEAMRTQIEDAKKQFQESISNMQLMLKSLQTENDSLKAALNDMQERNSDQVMRNNIFVQKTPKDPNSIEEAEGDLVDVLGDVIGDMVSPKSKQLFEHFLLNIIYSDQPVLTDTFDGDALGSLLSYLYSDGEYYKFTCEQTTSNKNIIVELEKQNLLDNNCHVVVIHGVFGKLDLEPLFAFLEEKHLNLKLIFTIPKYNYLKFIAPNKFIDRFIFFKGNFINKHPYDACHIAFSEMKPLPNFALEEVLSPLNIHAPKKIFNRNIAAWLFYSIIPSIKYYRGFDEDDVISKLESSQLRQELEELYRE